MVNAVPIVVVIPTHDRLPLFKRTLDSVLACNPPVDRVVRLIVVENGGRFGVEDYLKQKKTWLSPEYLYVEEGNKSSALNAVVNALDDELLVFLDDDVRVAPELLQQYSNYAKRYSSNCFFGGPMAADYVKPPQDWLLSYLPVSAKGWEPKKYKPIYPEILWFMGCNWAAYIADIRRAGSFNPNLGPGAKSNATGQESFMQQALVKVGVIPVYIPQARVWHYVPYSRSSPKWALERAFRNGVTSGLKYKTNTSSNYFLNVPPWMIRRRLELTAKALIARLAKNNNEAFEARYKLAEFCGQMKGVRISQKKRKQTELKN